MGFEPEGGGSGGGPQVLDWVNVKTSFFGAKGDGITDDTSAIQNAINSLAATGGVVYLPTGVYKISSAITLHTQIILQGDSIGQSFSLGGGGGPTVIKQVNTTANGIYQNDATQTGIRDLMLLGPSSGSGDGIHLTWTFNTNVFQCDMQDVQVSSFGGHGVYGNTVLMSNWRMVVSSFNGGDGFHLVGTCTSLSIDSCWANSNSGYGWNANSINYCSWNACGADTNANGWLLTNCQGCSITGSGTENNTTDGLTINGGFGYTISGFWVSHKRYGVHVTSTTYGTVLDSICEFPLTGATYSIYAESGSIGVVLNPSTQTAQNIPFGFWQQINGGGSPSVNTEVTVTASSYTAVSTDSVIFANAVSNAITVNIPSPAGIAGRQFTIFKTDSSGNGVTVQPAAGTMGGYGSSISFFSQYQGIAAVSDGTNWQITSYPITTGQQGFLGEKDFYGLLFAHGGFATSISTQTANYNVQFSDSAIIMNGSSLTATLPDATSDPGIIFTVKNKNSSACTVATTSSQTIDGSTTHALTQYQSIIVQSDGSNWQIIANN